MKLALFGRGAMGSVVATAAPAAGHTVGAVLTSADADRSVEDLSTLLRGYDAAIDFSVAEAVVVHADACARAGVPLVEGTTGWQEREREVRHAVDRGRGALVYGANFSIGVNLFYRVTARAGELFRGLSRYGAFIEEAHHAKKRDAPSGTAIRLREILEAALGYKVPVASTRAGWIPGTHRVGFDSTADQIVLTHTARSRDSFAAGALLAATWIAGRRGGGVYTFADVLDEMLALERRDTP